MATRYAVATGNWSSTSTWDGGTLPGTTDDVYTNNFTVTIDQDITVNSLRSLSNASPAITAGGSFVVSSGTRALTVTAGINMATHGNPANGANLLTLSGGTVTLNANVTGGAGTNRHAVAVTGATFTVNGTVTGGSSTSASHGIRVTSGTATLTVNGNVTGATGSAISIQSGYTVTITGAVSGGSGDDAHGLASSNTSARITIIGSVSGGTSTVGNVAYGVFLTGGKVRLDAALRWGAGGMAPVQGQTSGTPVVFVRGGSSLDVLAASDDNWTASTGAEIGIAGGGVDPKRYLNVSGTATPIQ